MMAQRVEGRIALEFVGWCGIYSCCGEVLCKVWSRLVTDTEIEHALCLDDFFLH
jgi:hypothetical protein